MKQNLFFLGLMGALALAGCSSVQDTTKPDAAAKIDASRAENRQAAISNDASYVTEISFAQNSSLLGQDSQARLQEIVNKARSAGTVDEVKVIAWSDREYPGNNKAMKISSEQKELASDRNKRIKEYLSDNFNSLDVDTYSMTGPPNALEKWLRTDDYKIKRSFETAGIGTDPQRFPSKVGKAVVMVILK